jgi:citrate lyase subunit beta / citryl-CoA lyase
MVRRSYLFVPGNRLDRFAKAWQSGADAVILDLEDAIPVAQKDQAREAVAAWLSRERPTYVRIHGPGTPWFERDLEAVRKPGIMGIVLPYEVHFTQLSHSLLRTHVRTQALLR